MLVRRDFLSFDTSGAITLQGYPYRNFDQSLVAGYFTNIYWYLFCTNVKCVQYKATHLSTMFLDFRIRLTSPAVAGP